VVGRIDAQQAEITCLALGFMKEIKKDTTLAEILENPEAVKILAKYNLPCLSCPFAKLEMENLRIGEICKMYDINVERLLRELNGVYKK